MQVDKYQIPEDLFYDTNDYWIKVSGDEAVIGMTDYGQSNTGDILYLELLDEGACFGRGDRCGSIESGKWVGNLIAPVSGTVLEYNAEVMYNPRKINADASGAGWMYRLKLEEPVEIKALMGAEHYARWVAAQIKKEQELN